MRCIFLKSIYEGYNALSFFKSKVLPSHLGSGCFDSTGDFFHLPFPLTSSPFTGSQVDADIKSTTAINCRVGL